MVNQRFFYLVQVIGIYSLYFLWGCGQNIETNHKFDGHWSSIGGGTYLEIKRDTCIYFDHTEISCIPIRKTPIEEFGNTIQLIRDTLMIRKGLVDYLYQKLDRLPPRCYQPKFEVMKNNVKYNFEVFGKTIEKHFVFFELNKINWDSLFRHQQNKLHVQSTDVELYQAMEETLEKINDNHGYLEGSNALYEQLEKLDKEEIKNTENQPGNHVELKEYGDFQIANMVADHYLEKDLTEDSWLIKWGKMKNNIGFIQIKAMWLYADLHLSDSLVKENGLVETYVDAFHQLDEGKYIDKEKVGVSKVMDRVMDDLMDADNIIMDVRFNGGGQDAVGFEILSRFNDQKRAVAKQKIRYGDGFSPTQEISLEAADRPFLKPVFILISPQTGSAAESFSLASMSLPHIQLIGSHTAGALSTALEKKLPNGWHFAISNEIYTDMNGRFYENIGVPPDYKINYPEDRQTFFRFIADNLMNDMESVLGIIENID